MARKKRIMVGLSLPMEVALDVLSERQGLSPSTMAFVRLREALQRTIDTPLVQERVKAETAQRTRDDWAHDQAMVAEQLRLEGVEADESGVDGGQGPDASEGPGDVLG